VSALSAVQEQLLTVSGLIAQLERVVATEQPVRPSTLANIRALEKERRVLQEQFSRAAESASLDVYRYRVLNRSEPTIGGLTRAWLGFQRALSVVYHAQSGPVPAALIEAGRTFELSSTEKDQPLHKKQRKTKAKATQPTQEPFSELQLGFGYAFSGSVGVALTIPNHKTGELYQDQAIQAATDSIFDMIKSYGNEEKVVAIARRLGKAPVDAMYQWIDTHIQQGFGLAIEWRRDNQTRRDVLAQVEELKQLRDEISRTTSESQITTDGWLVALDTTAKTFRLDSDDGISYEGSYVDVITEEHKASLPARYSVAIVKVTKFVVIGADPDGESFQLKSLDAL
jgi:hypothetical protein